MGTAGFSCGVRGEATEAVAVTCHDVRNGWVLLVAGMAVMTTSCGTASGTPSGPPSPGLQRLSGAGLAYDAADDAVVAFGGQSRHGRVVGPSRTTWQWTGSRWRRMHLLADPPARSQALLATDPSTGRVLLFGGQAESYAVPSCRPPSPGPGVQSCAGSVSPVRVLADTWTLGGSGWHRLARSGRAPQQGRLLASDAAHGQVVLVGASRAMSTRGAEGTWAWRAGRWALLSPTAPELATTMALDPASHRLVAYGGQAAFTPAAGMGAPAMPGYRRTWVLRGRGWVEVHPATPPARAPGVLTVSPDGSTLLLVQSAGATWAWTGGVWQRQPTIGRPSGQAMAAATDPARHEVVLLVGTAHGDATWTLHDGRWTFHGRAP